MSLAIERSAPLIRKFFLLALLMGAVAACSPSSRSPCAPGKLCLNAGNVTDPTSLDPPKTQLTNEDNIISDLFVGLITDDAAGRSMPGLATGWTTSKDGRIWTFTLRPALWSDGAPLTAQDVVFSLRRLVDPKTASPYASLVYPILNAEKVNLGQAPLESLGVAARDPRTVVIKLEHPTPYLPELLKHQITAVVPEHAIRRWGDAWTLPEHFVSDGPFTLKSWALGDRIRLVKNPRFYDEAHVCLDEVDYYPVADAVSALRRVKRGELDLTISAPSSRMALLRRPGQMPAYVHTATYLGVTYLAFNSHVAALRDARVRRALNLALDREFYTGKLLRAGQPAAYGFVPPGVAAYGQGPEVNFAHEPLALRRRKARALLAAAGYSDRRPLSFELKSTIGGDGAVIPAAIQADFAAIGVRVRLQPEEGQIFYTDLDSRNFDVAIAQWIADYDDAMSFLYLMRSETGAQNYGDYMSSSYDAAVAAADAEADPKRRTLLMKEAEAIMLRDDAVAPIYFLVSRNLVNPRLTGWVDNIVDHHRKRWICFSDAAPSRLGLRAPGAAAPAPSSLGLQGGRASGHP